MGKNQQMIKLFLTLFVCTAFIFSVSYFGSQFIEKNNKAIQTATKETQKTAKNANTASNPQPEAVLNEAVVKLDTVPDDLQTFLAAISNIKIPAQATFSLLDLATKKKLETLSSDTLSMIATGIYQAILPSNFMIEERNIGSELPAYTKLGFEAKVKPAEKEDLVFSNPNKTDYVLALHQVGDSLIVDLKGANLPNDYKITTKAEQQLVPKTISQYSPLLYPGQTKVMNAGKNGMTIKIYRDTYQGNIFVNSEFISNDYYPPKDQVVVQSIVSQSTQQTTGSGTVGTTGQLSGSSNNQANQGNQTTSGTQTSAGSSAAAQNAASSDLWGSPNEPSK